MLSKRGSELRQEKKSPRVKLQKHIAVKDIILAGSLLDKRIYKQDKKMNEKKYKCEAVNDIMCNDDEKHSTYR